MNKLCARRFINNLKSIAKGLASAGLNSARIPQIRLHVNIKILFRNAALPRLCPDKAEEGRRKEEGGRDILDALPPPNPGHKSSRKSRLTFIGRNVGARKVANYSALDSTRWM
jgi:hypothetical protein